MCEQKSMQTSKKENLKAIQNGLNLLIRTKKVAIYK